MPSLSLSQAFTLYGWFPLAALLYFLLLIARFYQKFSGHSTYYRLFLVPVVLFGMGAVRSTSVGHLQADTLADVLYGLGGLVLLALTLRLYRLMIVSRVRLEKPPS